MTRDEIDQISFDIPQPQPPTLGSVGFYGARTFGQAKHRFDRFYCTVYSQSEPPADWGSGEDFPTDLVVLHHSPRSLTYSKAHKNWRIWKNGEHRYTDRNGSRERRWVAPEFFKPTLRKTYVHINVEMHLKRGTVLCLTGHTIEPLRLNEHFELEGNPDYPAVFGTANCPWFFAQSVDVYTAWPESPIDPADPYASLIKLPSPTPIALPNYQIQE